MALRATVVAADVATPFGLTFLPDGRALATDRGRGRLLIVDAKGGAVRDVRGVPAVNAVEDGGLLDVQLDAHFRRNATIYYSFTEDSAGSSWVARTRSDSTRASSRLIAGR